MLVEVNLTVDGPVSECAIEVDQQPQQSVEVQLQQVGDTVKQVSGAATLNCVEHSLTREEQVSTKETKKRLNSAGSSGSSNGVRGDKAVLKAAEQLEDKMMKKLENHTRVSTL